MNINHTLKVIPFSIKPGTTFWEVYAKVDESKVLAGQLILGWISRFGLKPVEVHAYFKPEGEVIVRAILDASRVEAPVKEIERRLKEAEGVLDVKIYVSPIQGLGLPLSVRGLMVGDSRAVIVRDTVFSKLINCLKDVCGVPLAVPFSTTPAGRWVESSSRLGVEPSGLRGERSSRPCST